MNNNSQISYNDSRLETINSIRSSLTSRINKAKPKHVQFPQTPITTLPLDKYNDIINSSMRNYQLTYQDFEKKKLSSRNNLITYEDQVEIRKVHNFNKSFENRLGPLNEESSLKVNVQELNYKNPYNSISILRNNHYIYNEINKDFLLRQKQKFDDSIKTFEGYTMKYKVKMPKIRVAIIQPKFNVDVPIIDISKDNKEEIKKKKKKYYLQFQKVKNYVYFHITNTQI